MSAPRVTATQLRPIVDEALERSAGSRQPPDVVLVHADPDSATDIGTLEGRHLTVIGSRSPLEIRARLVGNGGGPLVVLTDLDNVELGADLLARAAGRKVQRPDRWLAVSRLFGAEKPSPALARAPELADALIDALPLAGYPQVTSRVLELDVAVAALVSASWGVGEDVVELDSFLAWAMRPDAIGRIVATDDALFAMIQDQLVDRLGSGVVGALSATRAGLGDQVVALGLVADVLAVGEAEGSAPAVRFDERLRRPGLTPEQLRGWGEAARSLVGGPRPGSTAGHLPERSVAATWVDRADRLLDDLGGSDLAHHSSVLRSGFERRITMAGEALHAWLEELDDEGAAATASEAVKAVRRHGLSGSSPERHHRLEMALRMIRRGGFALEIGDLSSLAVGYQRDGAWLDAARVVVSRGDPDPVVSAVCRRLTTTADAARLEQGPMLARRLRSAAEALPVGLVGVEDVLDTVVAGLGEERQMLLVVLDGLGLPTFTDIVGDIEQLGWSLWTPDDQPTLIGVAALPTVTELSRTSLLCGRLRRGDGRSEERGFAGSEALARSSRPAAPPVLFPKVLLRQGGLDTVPHEILDTIADRGRQYVGVIVNSIDERLKDVNQPVAGWGLSDLAPLGEILESARAAGRVVVLTGDHGHVLDRDAEHRTAPGGGERWRPSGGGAPADGEIDVEGPRVVLDGQRAVLPWKEQLQYGTRRNGYHGGLTPQEVFVPLAVLCDDDELPGWTGTAATPPAWWHETTRRPTSTAVERPTVPKRRQPPPPPSPTLFDEPGDGLAEVPESTTASEPVPTAGSAWVEQVLTSPVIAEIRQRNRRVRLSDTEITALLRVLGVLSSDPLPASRLAEEAGLPPARIARYLAQLQELVNVDGVQVLTLRDDHVRFDRQMLDRQLGT